MRPTPRLNLLPASIWRANRYLFLTNGYILLGMTQTHLWYQFVSFYSGKSLFDFRLAYALMSDTSADVASYLHRLTRDNAVSNESNDWLISGTQKA